MWHQWGSVWSNLPVTPFDISLSGAQRAGLQERNKIIYIHELTSKKPISLTYVLIFEVVFYYRSIAWTVGIGPHGRGQNAIWRHFKFQNLSDGHVLFLCWKIIFIENQIFEKNWDIGDSLVLIMVFEMLSDIMYISGKNDWCKQWINGNKKDKNFLLFCS